MSNASLGIAGAAIACMLAAAIAIIIYLRKRGHGTDAGGFFGSRQRRIDCVERLNLDGGRRLLLVRRDNVEHLIMIGGGADLVVETGIKITPILMPSTDAVYHSTGSFEAARDHGNRAGPAFGDASSHSHGRAAGERAASGYPALTTEEPLDLTPHSEIGAMR